MLTSSGGTSGIWGRSVRAWRCSTCRPGSSSCRGSLGRRAAAAGPSAWSAGSRARRAAAWAPGPSAGCPGWWRPGQPRRPGAAGSRTPGGLRPAGWCSSDSVMLGDGGTGGWNSLSGEAERLSCFFFIESNLKQHFPLTGRFVAHRSAGCLRTAAAAAGNAAGGGCSGGWGSSCRSAPPPPSSDSSPADRTTYLGQNLYFASLTERLAMLTLTH